MGTTEGLHGDSTSPAWRGLSEANANIQGTLSSTRDALLDALSRPPDAAAMALAYEPAARPPPSNGGGGSSRDPLLVLLPLLIVLSTLLFLLLLFLVCVLLLRRRRGIQLRDNDGPIDMSREDLIEGEGGFEGIEERWLETVSEEDRRSYRRAKEYQTQYPPNSMPTDITLSQFLSIQEKGVSAWCFEPDYESLQTLLVHARTELTFLPDPGTSSCVQSNLPLPKLNEVYYWEVKLFDFPDSTSIAIGLATKPYPTFRLPGLNRYSVAYHSSGDKSYNYPFTAQTYGGPMKEGDVVGVGYRPRTGTVFYTRNGRKMEDAFVGLTRWNLFPTVGADGPCSLHINLGQSGFVFIEANVKKWGLAPSVGTLAPPPAYGSERGSILLEAGGGVRSVDAETYIGPPPSSSRRSQRSRRQQPGSTAPIQSSPLRGGPTTPLTPPPPITPIIEESSGTAPSSPYVSPTDAPPAAPAANLPPSPPVPQPQVEVTPPATSTPDNISQSSRSRSNSRSSTPFTTRPVRNQSHSRANSAAGLTVRLQPPPDSPMNPDPPTPNQADIHLTPIQSRVSPEPFARASSAASIASGESDDYSSDGVDDANEHIDSTSDPAARPPPAYSPLDAYRYAEGVHVDLPAEVIAAALEGGAIPDSAIGQSNVSSRGDRHRSRRERHPGGGAAR